jgi:hypothetical protein
MWVTYLHESKSFSVKIHQVNSPINSGELHWEGSWFEFRSECTLFQGFTLSSSDHVPFSKAFNSPHAIVFSHQSIIINFWYGSLGDVSVQSTIHPKDTDRRRLIKRWLLRWKGFGLKQMLVSTATKISK